jgi:DNA-binding NarL/FixJ family response regulator
MLDAFTTDNPPRWELLTRKEREVAALLGEGWTNSEIARALGRSPSTVKQQVASILARLHISSRARFAALWHTTRASDTLRTRPWRRISRRSHAVADAAGAR